MQNFLLGSEASTAAALGMLARLDRSQAAEDVFDMPETENYDPDDGPLTERQVEALRKDVASLHPRGRLLSRSVLFHPVDMPCEHDHVELLVDLSGMPSLKAGSRGVVVHRYPNGRACEVEFLRESGDTICVQTVDVDHLKLLSRGE